LYKCVYEVRDFSPVVLAIIKLNSIYQAYFLCYIVISKKKHEEIVKKNQLFKKARQNGEKK